MEHGSSPTSYPGRTPIQIVGRCVVLIGFPRFLILHQPPERYGIWFESDQLPWSNTLEPTPKCYGIWACPTSPPRRTPVLALKKVRYRWAFPQKRNLQKSCFEKWASRADVDCPAKNARIITQNSNTPGIWMGVRPGELVGHQPCSITLWWLVRVRPVHYPVASNWRNPA